MDLSTKIDWSARGPLCGARARTRRTPRLAGAIGSFTPVFAVHRLARPML
jgi:hypothetical protein